MIELVATGKAVVSNVTVPLESVKVSTSARIQPSSPFAGAPASTPRAVASAGSQNERLGSELHVKAGELVRLQAEFDHKSREAAELASTIPDLMTGSTLMFRDIKVSNKRYPMSIKMRDGAHIKNRFRENLLGQAAFD